ncbi:hypothetical protein DV515_00005601, partial [Chloebia gouldiae]
DSLTVRVLPVPASPRRCTEILAAPAPAGITRRARPHQVRPTERPRRSPAAEAPGTLLEPHRGSGSLHRLPPLPHRRTPGTSPAAQNARKDARGALAGAGARGAGIVGSPAKQNCRRLRCCGNCSADPLKPGSPQREGGAAMPSCGAASPAIHQRFTRGGKV